MWIPHRSFPSREAAGAKALGWMVTGIREKGQQGLWAGAEREVGVEKSEVGEVKRRQSEVLSVAGSTRGSCHIRLLALPFNPLLFGDPGAHPPSLHFFLHILPFSHRQAYPRQSPALLGSLKQSGLHHPPNVS